MSALPPQIEEKLHYLPWTGCWIWGGRVAQGYGQIYWEGRTHLIHRVVWKLLTGSEAQYTLDHLCEVKSCCNPAHLEDVPGPENSHRQVARRRARGEGMKEQIRKKEMQEYIRAQRAAFRARKGVDRPFREL